MRKILFLLLGISLATSQLSAQVTFPRNDVLDERAGAYALTNATLIIDQNTTLNAATMLIREGKIERVGANVIVPAGYTAIDLKGKYVYPGFIDIYTNYGLPKVERPRDGGWGSAEQMQPKTKGAYNANEAIKSEYNAAEEFTIDSKTADEMRKLGFGAVLSFRPDGIARGTSALVTLAEESDNNSMISEKAAAHYSFNRGTSRQNYPSSAMGFIALLRQTYLDADWYLTQNPKPFKDQSLEAWISTQSFPQVFEATDWLTTLRADKVGDEFGVQYIIKGGGDEYKRIAEVKNTNARMIIPVNFPDAYDVEDPFDAERVSLADMKHWEMAPANLAALEAAGIQFAITSHGLAKKSDFLKNVRKAIKYGLSEKAALAAMTSNPAGMLNMNNRVGSLKAGSLANFFISSESIFNEKAMIHENWVQGQRFSYKDLDVKDLSGNYKLGVDGQLYNLSISGEPGSHKAEIVVDDTTKISVDMKMNNELITLSFESEKGKGRTRLSGWQNGNGFNGEGQVPDGTWVSWNATFESAADKSDKDRKKSDTGAPEIGDVIYPFVAHGTTTLPQTETILIKNATVWTNEAEGILEETDVLLQDGRIQSIGKGLSANGARTIDGTGKHLTPGVIDEHSHTAASSINDRAVNSGMVRIGDVIDPEDFGIYRALAGGVVAIQILHGSANPIGGQSALIKLRWGASPEEMKIKGADGFIKFALGENVKRSRSTSSIRYPQTRMGVEQIFVDAFTNAVEYKKEWNAYNSLSSKARATALKPRRDLMHDTMVEIIDSKRFISCHSYVQSEINMLMKVAEQFDFRINTFTHILEGYKVADKMKAHGVGASTFSDWWNYKWEVRYAIPYNAAILHNEGVVTAINSDSGELIRRLNQEAAKSLKYGGMDEQDALKMVTLNPAKLLHLDDEMGSIKKGKSADVVLWTDHPLSIYAKADKTIVDGKVYFDLERDAQINTEIKTERARLIQKMKDAKKNGAATRRGGSPRKVEFHCEDVLGEEADLDFRF
jgi:imidazolonepropionase-like amidohydrolase